MDASRRASTLVSQLVGFSRKTRLELKPHDVNQIMARTQTLFEPCLPNTVSLELNLEANLPPATVDDTQLEQVLLNICLNAKDAVGETGRIRMSTSRTCEGMRGSPPSQILISISDSGQGMTEKIRSRIFEPYFTTREGSGSGLGLAMSEGIVHQHGGRIECDSAIGKGTEFRIYLPVNERKNIPRIHGEALVGGRLAGHRILIVDDEKLVRKSLGAMLNRLGAETKLASNGHECLEMLTNAEQFDTILLDWNMPGITGQETLEAIKALSPRQPVIICSGLAFAWEDMTDPTSRPEAVLSKPFGSNEVADEIIRIVEARRSQDNTLRPSTRSRLTGAA